jgi:hypothetical protein
MADQAPIFITCQSEGEKLQITRDEAWLTILRSGDCIFGWHCTCGLVHQKPVTHLQASRLLRTGIRRVDLNRDAELDDTRRGLVLGRLTEDDIEAALDQLNATADVDPVSLLPSGVVAAVRARLEIRERADAAVTRVRTVMGRTFKAGS